MKLSQGDTVHVISGKDKGKRGTIMRVLKEQNRVIVSGVNMVTKHVRKTANEAGKKLQFERSISASNVMIVDPKTNKPTRVGYQIDAKTGAKARVAKGSKTVIGRTKVEAPKAKQAPASTAKAPSKDKKDAAPAGKKSPFWKNIGFGKDAAQGSDTGASGKAESGPATSTPGHTRSAGRGS
jgi:large subunit ribosomal protein L24